MEVSIQLMSPASGNLTNPSWETGNSSFHSINVPSEWELEYKVNMGPRNRALYVLFPFN